MVSSIFEGIHFCGFRKIPFREYIYLWTVVLTMSSVVSDLISIRIYLTSKSMKIGVQQILMKPDYLFYSVVISVSFYSSELFACQELAPGS